MLSLSNDSQEQAPFSKSQLGQFQSLFAISYSISFLVCGILSDVVNVKVMFAAGLASSGFLLFLFPFTQESQILASLVYVCLGFSLGCGWPSTAKILRKIFPPSELGMPWGVMSTSSSFATLVSPLLVYYIISASSWKYSFFVFGITAMLLALPIYAVTSVSDSVRVLRDEERRFVPASGGRWFHVVLLGRLWGVMLVHAMMWVVKASVQDWGQLYLMQQQQLDQVNAGECTYLVHAYSFIVITIKIVHIIVPILLSLHCSLV